MKKSVRRLATLSASAGLLIGGLGLVENSNAFETNYVQAATYKIKLTKSSYVYTSKGKRTDKKLKKGKTYKCYGKKKINGKWFYKLGKSRFIRVVNAKKVVTPAKNIFSSIQSSISSSIDSSNNAGNNANTVIPYSASSASSGSISSASARSVAPTMADGYNPNAYHSNGYVVLKNSKVDASDVITNKYRMPQGTTYAWKNAPDTSKTGISHYSIVVTYPDKSQDTVDAELNIVSSYKDYYEPTVNEDGYDVVKGEKVNAADVVTNKYGYSRVSNRSSIRVNAEIGSGEMPDSNQLPQGTTFAWKKEPDTSTYGYKECTVIATYPDGSKDSVKAIINVLTESEMYKPSVQSRANIELNSKIDVSDFVTNKNELPKGTAFEWYEGAPDTSRSTSGNYGIKAVYPDGSTEEAGYVRIKVVIPD